MVDCDPVSTLLSFLLSRRVRYKSVFQLLFRAAAACLPLVMFHYMVDCDPVSTLVLCYMRIDILANCLVFYVCEYLLAMVTMPTSMCREVSSNEAVTMVAVASRRGSGEAALLAVAVARRSGVMAAVVDDQQNKINRSATEILHDTWLTYTTKSV